MKKIFRVLLIVMLLITTGCNKEGNGGGKPALKTTEIGDGLINSYRSTGKYSKVERDYLPKEIADIGLDYIVYEQESDFGTIKGFTVVINDKDKDAILTYMDNLANSTYENLVKEDAGMIVIYYNNEIPIAISVVIMDFSDEFCAIMYESMPATVDDFYDWRY
ncbi:MAG TPA: hypothetical protein PLT36_00075 [Erysipelotrichaceae bacterium]|jgi:hypothetical protein|nr:hypothetical protein [Erysipelotrichaceae bacterium]HQA84400.1 hypothetical protein [Erysipelotrichaceae bacterium]